MFFKCIVFETKFALFELTLKHSARMSAGLTVSFFQHAVGAFITELSCFVDFANLFQILPMYQFGPFEQDNESRAILDKQT